MRLPVWTPPPIARESGVNFAAGSHPEYIQQQRVSSGFFRVLGIQPQYGREFTRAEDVSGGPALAVLSYGFWQRVFQGDPQAIGRTIMLRGEPYTVVGIMPQSFRASAPVDVWTPLRPSPDGEGSGSNYGAIARLKPGVSWPEAGGQLAAISRVIQDTGRSNAPRGVTSKSAWCPISKASPARCARSCCLPGAPCWWCC